LLTIVRADIRARRSGPSSAPLLEAVIEGADS